MKSKIILSALITSILLSSCSKDNSVFPASNNGGTGGSTAKAAMNYQLKASNTIVGIRQKATADGSIRWTSGFANPTLIKFEATQSATEVEYKSTNNTQIDLFSGIASSFGNFTLPVGNYNEVELKVQLAKNGTSPALKLTGSFSNTSTTIPVVFQIDDALEIKTETNNVTIDSTSSFTAITTFDLSSFTNGITESMVVSGQLTSGTLIISRSTNRNLFDIIMNNFSNKQHHCEIEHHH